MMAFPSLVLGNIILSFLHRDIIMMS